MSHTTHLTRAPQAQQPGKAITNLNKLLEDQPDYVIDEAIKIALRLVNRPRMQKATVRNNVIQFERMSAETRGAA